MLWIALKIEVVVVDKLLKRENKKKNPARSDFFSHSHCFTLHLSLRRNLKHLSSLSDSVSFVGALRSCLNVRSRQSRLSSQCYLERAQGKQDHRGKNLSQFSQVSLSNQQFSTLSKRSYFFVLEGACNFSIFTSMHINYKPKYVVLRLYSYICTTACSYEADEVPDLSWQPALCWFSKGSVPWFFSALFILALFIHFLMADKSSDSVMVH